jgi:NAD(P)-dependent dehydrogenase (short-subunit alcohol dehydrogenase family)
MSDSRKEVDMRFVPDEVATAIVFPSAPDARYVNGASLTVDGGVSQVSALSVVSA